MLLYLARSAQSQWDAGEVTHGDDPVLTDTGWEQAKRLARRVADENPAYIYAAPQPRALQTLEPIRDEFPVLPFIHPMFCEQWDSDMAGWPRWRLQEAFRWAELPEVVTDQPWWPSAPESEMELFARANRVAQFLREHHPAADERVLLISNVTFGDVLLSVLFGLSPCNHARFMQRNAGITLVNVWNEGAQMAYLSDPSHLPRELWT